MASGKKNYHDVVSEAVDDLAEHGFTSVERVAFWQRKIREAAEGFLGSAAQMEQQLRDALAATYKRMVDSGKIAKYHPGVARWTIEKVRPSLRAELDRRILASANLIRLNREQAIAKTLQRFSGWSTSIPPGGASEPNKREEKARIQKPMAQVRFETRRVLTDQGHKLTSALNEIVSTDGGAIIATWRSNYRQPNYDYREDHKERDGVVYSIRDSWAMQKGFVKKSPNGYVDEITRPAEETFCRCWYVYGYGLRDVPDDMLTKLGRETLEEARRKMRDLN